MNEPKFLNSIIILIIVSFSFISSCSDNPVDPEPDSNYKTLTVNPTHGSPGQIITISGLDFNDIDIDSLVLMIGEEQSSVIYDSTGLIQTIIPLFIDSTGWAQTYLEPLDVSVLVADELIGLGAMVLTIDSLPHAPGETQKVVDSLAQISATLEEIFNDLPNVNEEFVIYRSLYFGLIDSILISNENSLVNLLNGTSPLLDTLPDSDIALLDALIAASGVRDEIDNQLRALRDLRTQQQLMVSSKNIYRSFSLNQNEIYWQDYELAWMMQFYVVLKNFGNDFISPIKAGWGNTFGMMTSILKLVKVDIAKVQAVKRVVPLAALVTTTLTVLDIVINKFALGMLPATINELKVDIMQENIKTGDTAKTNIYITARNIPTQYTLSDFIGELIKGFGLNTKDVKTFNDFLQNVATWYFGMATKIFKSTLDSLGTSYGFSFNQVPEILYGPTECFDATLIECYSFTPNILKGATDTLLWIPPTDQGVGEVRIQARTKGNEGATINIPGYDYTGGAWGENSKHSIIKSVFVTNEVFILTEFPSNVAANATAELKVRVGLVNGNNDTTWAENTAVDLLVDLGRPVDTSGLTDADGWFTTQIQIDNEEGETLTIEISTNDINANQGYKEITALISDAFVLEIGFPNVPEFPPYMLTDSSLMSVRVGIETTIGNIDWQPGWDIVVQVWAGHVNPQNGITNGDAFFFANTGYDPTSDSMEIIVTASKDGNSIVDTAKVVKPSGQAGRVQITNRMYSANNQLRTEAYIDYDNPALSDVKNQQVNQDSLLTTFSVNYSLSSTFNSSEESFTANGSGTQTVNTSPTFDSEGHLLGITGSGSGSWTASVNRDPDAGHSSGRGGGASGNSGVQLFAEILDGYVLLNFDAVVFGSSLGTGGSGVGGSANLVITYPDGTTERNYTSAYETTRNISYSKLLPAGTKIVIGLGCSGSTFYGDWNGSGSTSASFDATITFIPFGAE